MNLSSNRAVAYKRTPVNTRTFRRIPYVTANAQPDNHARHVPLQGGNAFWLLDPMQDSYFNVRGQDFIIQRPETFAKMFPKLRLRKLYQRHYDIQVTRPASEDGKGSTALIKSDSADHAHAGVPMLFEGQPFIDVTQYLEELVVEEDQQAFETSSGLAGLAPCSTAPGLVQTPQQAAQDKDAQEVFIGSSTSPRRTKMVGFTCQRCKARSYKPVNPLAFQEGTLVVQCGKCRCWHKIKDHLNLFHDLHGEIFLRPARITNADIPESLRMPLEPFYWHDHEGGDASNN